MISKYEIRFFQVGQKSKGGDAIVIRLYDDNNAPIVIVIDGGYQVNGKEIVEFLKDNGLDTIDLMVNTHPDIDHISGLTEIVRSKAVGVKKLLMNTPWRDANLKSSYFKDGRITDDSLNRRLKDAFRKASELESEAQQRNVTVVHPVVGQRYFDCLTVLGPSTEFYRKKLLDSEKTPGTLGVRYLVEERSLNQPFAQSYLTTRNAKYDTEHYDGWSDIAWFDDEVTSDINETSVVLSLELLGERILFTGDAGKEALANALDYYERTSDKVQSFRCVQLPHHGSRKNVDSALLQRIGASTYFVSCPPDGIDEGHFSRCLVNMILHEQKSARIFTTQHGWLSHYHNIAIEGSAAIQLEMFCEMDGKANK